MINRSKPIATDRLCWFFNELKGFYNWGNQELQGSLWRWNLLEEQHRTDEQLAYSFLKWSFTVSYLELINALQWLSAGILLYRLHFQLRQCKCITIDFLLLWEFPLLMVKVFIQ
jgi:hypothetical protein